MRMIDENNLTQYAKNISRLTFEMEKVCRTKEVFFCDTINLTPVEFRCLRYLVRDTFPQLKELASEMDLTPSRVTNLLNSLEKKGYILREISSKDRRIMQVNLTEIGRVFANDIQDKYVKFHEDILSSIDDETNLLNMLTSMKTFQTTLEEFLINKGEKSNGK